MNKFISCGKCKDGFYYEGDYCFKCDCLKKYQNSIRIEIGISYSGIKDDYIPELSNYKGNDTLGNLIKIKKYVEDPKYRKGSHLYLVGPNGSQKTYTSKAIIKEFIKKGIFCKFIIMNDLIKKLTDIYEEDYNNSMDDYYNCDLLVIDDCFDPKKVTIFKSGYQIPYLDEFIRKRIEQFNKNTIFTSNILIKDINEDKFSKDIKNLLKRSISDKGGELYFSDIYSSIEDNEILNMWN